MCGVTGILTRNGATAGTLGDRLRAMTMTLLHRGPDADGLWLDAES